MLLKATKAHIGEKAEQRDSEAELKKNSLSSVLLRAPTINDGKAINELITRCPPLDKNSPYCNFLQASHFHQTCLLALQQDEVVGFICAYLRPDDEKTLFIWQVAIDESQRGKGLAYRLLTCLLARDNLKQVTGVETSITQNNTASWKLFEKLDKAYAARGSVRVFLDKTEHFNGLHDTEYLYHIPLIH